LGKEKRNSLPHAAQYYTEVTKDIAESSRNDKQQRKAISFPSAVEERVMRRLPAVRRASNDPRPRLTWHRQPDSFTGTHLNRQERQPAPSNDYLANHNRKLSGRSRIDWASGCDSVDVRSSVLVERERLSGAVLNELRSICNYAVII
jgi:hypothetical protein